MKSRPMKGKESKLGKKVEKGIKGKHEGKKLNKVEQKELDEIAGGPFNAF